jgi:hypothetical protein
MKESLQSLYNTVSQEYDIGTYDSFSKSMQDSSKRRVFYDYLSEEYQLPDYETFELKVSSPEPSIDLNDVVTSTDEPEQILEPIPLTKIKNLTEALDYNKNNPQYIMSAIKDPDPKKKVENLQKNLPKFAMGLPVEALTDPTFLSKPRRISEFAKKPKEDEGAEEFEPTAKDVARFFNKRTLQKEMDIQMKKGRSQREAYRIAFSKMGGTPPNIINLAMDNSITGTVFRIAGLNQQVDVSDYPANKLEQLASGAISMVMPVDAALFAFGGKLANIKTVTKYADKAANILAKQTSLSLAEARVLTKNAFQRIVGGAGGFAAFDSGANIAEQIETTGAVDPIEALHATYHGVLTGGTVGSLGLVGT